MKGANVACATLPSVLSPQDSAGPPCSETPLLKRWQHRAAGSPPVVRASGAIVSNIREIKSWRAPTAMGVHYERLLGAIGTEEFGPAVRDSVMSVTAGARRIYLFEATGPEDTSLQYFHGEPGLVELFP